MPLLTYTSYDAIRAVLGVAETEILDSVLALPMYDLQFTLDLEALDNGGGKAAAQYTTCSAILIGARTANQQRYIDLINLLCAYSVAQKLLDNLPMFAPQTIQEGKASTVRAPDAHALVRRGVETMLAKLTNLINTLLQVLDPTANVTLTTTRRNISSVGLATDPVTGV
jgi:hypothetical protein